MHCRSYILSLIVGMLLIYVSTAQCIGACQSIKNIDGRNHVSVFLITITESDSDPTVIYQIPSNEPGPFEVTDETRRLLSEDEIQEMIRLKLPFRSPDPRFIQLSDFVDGYWNGSGLSVKDCIIKETATGTFKNLSFTEEAFPYPIAIVSYKLIRTGADNIVQWRIFPVYYPGQPIPDASESMHDETHPFLGTLSMDLPNGKGGIKLKYFDNRRVQSYEKTLGIEESWNLPFGQDAGATDPSQSQVKQENKTNGQATTHTIKLINHGVMFLEFIPEDKSESEKNTTNANPEKP